MFPEHFSGRMTRRGVTAVEVEQTFTEGWPCGDSRPGVDCRTLVFPFDGEWEGRRYEEKEVTVYFKYDGDELIWITSKARYGAGFPRGGAHA